MTTRKRTTNVELHARYNKRAAAGCRKMDRAFQKLLRATANFTRSRNELKYLERRLSEIGAAIKRGEEYPKERPVRKKRGRAIELD